VVEDDRRALAEIVARCGLCSAVAVDCGLFTTKETDDAPMTKARENGDG
jgi:hypothetical protein